MLSRSAVALCVIALLLMGCATKIRNIPNHPLARQSNGIAQRDHRECEQAITGMVKGVWFPAEVEFASCMIARDYQVYVQVLDASVEVRKASLRTKTTPGRVLDDLMMCERAVAKNVTLAEKIVRPMVMAAGLFFWPASVGGMAASAAVAVNRQRDYIDCMKPLGYVVAPWHPEPGEATFKTVVEDRSSP